MDFNKRVQSTDGGGIPIQFVKNPRQSQQIALYNRNRGSSDGYQFNSRDLKNDINSPFVAPNESTAMSSGPSHSQQQQQQQQQQHMLDYSSHGHFNPSNLKRHHADAYSDAENDFEDFEFDGEQSEMVNQPTAKSQKVLEVFKGNDMSETDSSGNNMLTRQNDGNQHRPMRGLGSTSSANSINNNNTNNSTNNASKDGNVENMRTIGRRGTLAAADLAKAKASEMDSSPPHELISPDRNEAEQQQSQQNMNEPLTAAALSQKLEGIANSISAKMAEFAQLGQRYQDFGDDISREIKGQTNHIERRGELLEQRRRETKQQFGVLVGNRSNGGDVNKRAFNR
ncbi:hypothetical protein HDU76_012472 [Blyttiomyces sp. JEL0837]|nr:hypothetical protein HDU76_012472 [Blyttiomyces sp. JEL0837]